MSQRTGLGAEHPLNDSLQAVISALFFGVWGLDSFLFHFSTVQAGVVPVLVRIPLVTLSFALGIYLVAKSEIAVFGRTLVGIIGEPKLVTTGVYSWLRHPMYLGSLLVLLGFFFATLSILSLLVWIGLFIFFDRMATYEEQDLIRILDEQYINYQKQVPNWLPRIRRKRNQFTDSPY
jgi:protein-S-isoprenylcysteine O-methyltransferase Ste14